MESTQQIAELIKGTKGKLFSLEFNPSEKELMVVWATDKKNYRMINLKTITSLKVNGVVNNFNNA